MKQEKILMATGFCGFFLSVVDLFYGLRHGFSVHSCISLFFNSAFCIVGFIGNRRIVCIWLALYSIFFALIGLPLQYFYIILLFFISNHKRKIKLVFYLYWGIMLIQSIFKPGTVHLLQQLVMSAGAFFLYTNTRRNRHFMLRLTEDEEFILNELMKGKQQKEIAKWNKNTVSKKLKQARERNGCLSNSELLLMYRDKDGLFPANADQSRIPSDV